MSYFDSLGISSNFLIPFFVYIGLFLTILLLEIKAGKIKGINSTFLIIWTALGSFILTVFGGLADFKEEGLSFFIKTPYPFLSVIIISQMIFFVLLSISGKVPFNWWGLFEEPDYRKYEDKNNKSISKFIFKTPERERKFKLNFLTVYFVVGTVIAIILFIYQLIKNDGFIL